MGIFDTQPTSNVQQPVTTQASQGDPGAGIFHRIGTADVSPKAVYPEPGLYPVLYVDAVKMIRSRKGDDLFTVEFLILQSAVDERPEGTKLTWQANMRHDAGPGNARAFIAAAMDCPLDEVTPEAATLACSAGNPCHGRLVRMSANQITTKAGNPFTVCDWSPLSPEFQAKAEEVKKEIFG